MSDLRTDLPTSDLRRWPQRLGLLFLTGSVSLSLVSIAASQILLAAALLAALLIWIRERTTHVLPGAVYWPALFLALWTVLAVFAASGSLQAALVKKLFLFSLLLIVPMIAGSWRKITWIYHATFAAAAVSAAAGLIQFAIDPHRDALHRIQGFMSIWMTYSGLLMLVLVALVAYAATYGWRKQYWILPLAAALAGALYLSQTRSALLGAVAGATAILLLKRPRDIVGLAALLLALYLASPASIQQRFRSGWNPEDPNTRNRIEVFGTALRLIQAHPWLGVGQKVYYESLRYRGTAEFPDWAYLHMHNNFLQIAAERGIPGLALWLWFMMQLVYQAFKKYRSGSRLSSYDKPAGDGVIFSAAAAIGVWIALMTSGMFEYNFGDSEVLTLFLFVMSAPHAAAATGANR